MSYYARNLPHWQPSGKDIFITWRLHGSLSPTLVQKCFASCSADSGKQFRIVDQELDRARTGPRWLENPQVADLVVDAIKQGENQLKLFDLHAFVVMPNHVHLLIAPKDSIARITKGIKGASSRRANGILGQVGRSFWQQESFDHWVRNASQLERIRAYIERNPVVAGLAKTPSEWRWSSAAAPSSVA